VKYLILILSITIGLLTPLFAENKGQPINISSNQLTAENNFTKFSGAVKVSMGDYILTSDELYVWYDKKGTIVKLIAKNNVKLINKNRIAVSNTAIFYKNSQKVILEGSPRIWEGNDEMKGKKIVLFLKKKKIIIKGASGIFSPQRLKNFKK